MVVVEEWPAAWTWKRGRVAYSGHVEPQILEAILSSVYRTYSVSCQWHHEPRDAIYGLSDNWGLVFHLRPHLPQFSSETAGVYPDLLRRGRSYCKERRPVNAL